MLGWGVEWAVCGCVWALIDLRNLGTWLSQWEDGKQHSSRSKVRFEGQESFFCIVTGFLRFLMNCDRFG